MSAVVVMPLTVDDPHRAAAAEYVTGRLAEDGWPVVTTGADIAPWCKAVAVDEALIEVEHWSWEDDVVIVHDADCVVDLTALRQAVASVECGDADWAIPYHHVVRYDATTTACVLAGCVADTPMLVRQPYVGVAGGGVVVLRRSTYDDCPLDRRFVGWGDEDESWGWALTTLHGRPWRHTADVVHLWHTPAVSDRTRRAQSLDSNRLRRAYRAYRDDPARMRALVVDAAILERCDRRSL